MVVWQIVRGVVGTALTIIGLASLPDDLAKWRRWLAMIPIPPDWYAPALILVGLLLLLTAFLPWPSSIPSLRTILRQLLPAARRAGPVEDLRVLFRSNGAPVFNQAHELLGAVARRLSDSEDKAAKAVGVLIQRFVMEADRAAWTRLGTALVGDDPAAEADRQPNALQRLFGDFYEKYQWMTTWIHQGRELVAADPDLEQQYQKWREGDRQFLAQLRLLIAHTGFERLRQEVERVGWADNLRQ